MAAPLPLPFHLPISGITIPSTPLIAASYQYLLENTRPSTVNHCLRSACFALLLTTRLPLIPDGYTLDTETMILSILLHDMGWATTPIISNNTRFEVDGANIARAFLSSQTTALSSTQIQLLWDAIALHTTPSIAQHKEPEVALAHLGITSDFLGPYMPPGSTEPGALISVAEYREILQAFPRAGFKDDLVTICCGLCRDKRETVWDNFVGEFGAEYGIDGLGGDKEEFAAEFEARRNALPFLMGGLERSAEFEGEEVESEEK
ncbi:hypothetical protein OQA88_5221 [Cercophora sp. LCS_1]